MKKTLTFRRKLILIQLLILAVTTVLAVVMISSSLLYRDKMDTISLFKVCKRNQYHYIDRIFINNTDMCLSCVSTENDHMVVCG